MGLTACAARVTRGLRPLVGLAADAARGEEYDASTNKPYSLAVAQRVARDDERIADERVYHRSSAGNPGADLAPDKKNSYSKLFTPTRQRSSQAAPVPPAPGVADKPEIKCGMTLIPADPSLDPLIAISRPLRGHEVHDPRNPSHLSLISWR